MPPGYSYVFLLLFVVNNSDTQIINRDYQNDYSLLTFDSEQEPINQFPVDKITPKIGNNVTLTCNHTLQKIIWEYSACRICNKDINKLEWKLKNQHKKYVSKLHLKMISLADSGFYKCVTNNKTLKIYEVDVIESAKYDGDPPKLLDVIPTNSTLGAHGNLVIQCKVYSQQQPTIVWLKIVDNNMEYDIEYDEQYFKTINTTNRAYPATKEEHVFVSKLNLHNVTNLDTGYYACLAITELGKDYKYFHIQVAQNRFEKDTKNLSVLFLIPLPFILIPICAWLCYYRKKNIQTNDELHLKQEHVLIERNKHIISQI